MFYMRHGSNMRNRRFDPFSSYLNHLECYTCHKFSHMVRDCMLPISSREICQKETTYS